MPYNFLRARLQSVQPEEDELLGEYQRYQSSGGRLSFEDWNTVFGMSARSALRARREVAQTAETGASKAVEPLAPFAAALRKEAGFREIGAELQRRTASETGSELELSPYLKELTEKRLAPQPYGGELLAKEILAPTPVDVFQPGMLKLPAALAAAGGAFIKGGKAAKGVKLTEEAIKTTKTLKAAKQLRNLAVAKSALEDVEKAAQRSALWNKMPKAQREAIVLEKGLPKEIVSIKEWKDVLPKYQKALQTPTASEVPLGVKVAPKPLDEGFIEANLELMESIRDRLEGVKDSSLILKKTIENFGSDRVIRLYRGLHFKEGKEVIKGAAGTYWTPYKHIAEVFAKELHPEDKISKLYYTDVRLSELLDKNKVPELFPGKIYGGPEEHISLSKRLQTRAKVAVKATPEIPKVSETPKVEAPDIMATIDKALGAQTSFGARGVRKAMEVPEAPAKPIKVLTDAQGKSIADRLGLRYDGVQENIGGRFTDIKGTGTTFYGNSLKEVKARLAETRATFEGVKPPVEAPKPIEATAKVVPEQLGNKYGINVEVVKGETTGEWAGGIAKVGDNTEMGKAFAANWTSKAAKDFKTTKEYPANVRSAAHEIAHGLFSKNPEKGQEALMALKALGVPDNVAFESLIDMGGLHILEPAAITNPKLKTIVNKWLKSQEATKAATTAKAVEVAPTVPRKPIWEGKTEGGQPPVEPPTKPTAEAAPELPSGRKPGGEGRAIAHDVQTPTEYEKAVEALTPTEYPLKARFKATSEAFMRKFYANWYPLRRLSEKSGIRADYMAQVVPGATAHGQDVVRRTLDPVFSRIGNDIDYLEQYMALKHDLDIAARFPEARLPGKVAGAGGAQTALNQLKVKIGAERFAALEQAGDELWKAHKEITIDRLVQEGLKTKEEAQAIVSTHPHYLPFQREDYIDDIGQAMSRPTASVSSTGIKKMDEVGSWLKLDNPLARFRTDAIKVENVIARNRAARGIVDALREMERQTGQSLITLVGGTEADRVAYGFVNRVDKAKTTLDVGYMSYFVDGKKFMVEVPRIIADVAKGIGDESISAIVSAIRSTNIPLQKGAVTYNPAFLVVNPLRDALSALFREKLVPFGRDWWAGFKSAVTKDVTFQEAAREGALYSGIVETMRSSKSMSKSFGQTGAISLRSPQDALLIVPRLISKLGGKIESANIVLEQATRLGTWKKLRAAGVEPLEAAVRTRDVTVDFAKMGSVMRQINAIIPFSNASLQGSVNTFRTIRDKPAWAATATMLFASPTVMSRAWNMQFDTSKEIPEYEYTNNWVIQIGEAMSKDNKKLPIYIKIPKGQIGSLLTFPAEVIFNAAQRNDDRTVLAMLLQSGIEAGRASAPFDPTISGILPPAIKTTVGIAFKTNPYTFLPIVPQSQQALPPEQQFGSETSVQSIAIGQKFKVSPRLIDFAVRDYTAGTGQAGMWLIDTALKGLGYKSEVYGSALTSKPSTAESLTSIPVVGRFLGAKGTGEERTLWELFRNKTTETKREFNQIPLMNSLGINLGEVGDSISNVDLTADQKIRYQQFMSEIVTEGVKEFSRSLSGTPEQQREAVQKEMRRLKDLAKDAFAAQEGIPVDVGGGLKIKSAPSTNTRKTGLLKPVRIK